VASAVLLQLLRHNELAGVREALFAESLAYSVLQHGAGFHAWLAGRAQRAPHDEADQPVLLQRRGAELILTLNRPGRHNAWSAAVRDAFCEGLQLVEADPSIERAVVRGDGESFCAGGDLHEFGQERDAGRAHQVRMTRSVAALIHELAPRLEFQVHGACIGAGIELPALAGRVVAIREAFFQLPEVGFGLLPGAGGTVGIPRRIGRLRTAWMALTRRRVSCEQALAWGLVDAVRAPGEDGGPGAGPGASEPSGRAVSSG
jgi:enoyl-CoA hydratase/carnithine racemase